MMSSINSNNKRMLDEHQLECHHHHQSIKQEENDGDEFHYNNDRNDRNDQHLVNSSDDDDIPQGGGKCNNVKDDEEEEDDDHDMKDIIAEAEREYERLTRIAEQNKHTSLEMVVETTRRVQNEMIVDNRPNKRARVDPSSSSSSEAKISEKQGGGGGRTAVGNEPPFDELMMGKLREYKKQHGTTNVSQSIDARLYKWLNHQRVKLRKGTLSKELASVLEDEGVDLKGKSMMERKFEEQLKNLREYKKQHGTTDVSKGIDGRLYNWFHHQRVKLRDGTLSKEHLSVLEDEGFYLTSKRISRRTRAFEEHVEKLREYKKLHGTANVSPSYDKLLYNWLNKQKVEHKEGTLRKKYASMLKDEGVDLNYKGKFEEHVENLRRYKKLHGTVNVSNSIDMPLNHWLNNQKAKYRKGTLLKKYVLVLEDEGVDLNFQWHTFQEHVEKFREYKQQHGTTDVVQSIDPPLYDWLNHQQVKCQEGTLPKEYASMLEEEGVDLKLRCQKFTFEERIDQIREYKKLYGTTNVFQSIDPPLCFWLNKQKVKCRDGTLPKEHASVLQDEGVDLTK